VTPVTEIAALAERYDLVVVGAGPAGLSAAARAGLRVRRAGARSVFHKVGVDPVVGDLPVFDGRKVLDGSLQVRLDQVLDRHGVLVLGTGPTLSPLV
jgi:alkyl hydroperoxide reductase subunit AhpF